MVDSFDTVKPIDSYIEMQNRFNFYDEMLKNDDEFYKSIHIPISKRVKSRLRNLVLLKKVKELISGSKNKKDNNTTNYEDLVKKHKELEEVKKRNILKLQSEEKKKLEKTSKEEAKKVAKTQAKRTRKIESAKNFELFKASCKRFIEDIGLNYKKASNTIIDENARVVENDEQQKRAKLVKKILKPKEKKLSFIEQVKERNARVAQQNIEVTDENVNTGEVKTKKSGKNLKIFKNMVAFLSVAMIAHGGYSLYQSGYFQRAIDKYKTDKYLEEMKEEVNNDSISSNMEYQTPISLASTITEEPIEMVEEEVVEEKHEYVNTDLYDSGYEFNQDITPQYLQRINPILSDNTIWLEIPGTKINNAVVLPTTYNIDEVPGLRNVINKTGYSDLYYMNNEYFAHNSINMEYSQHGTLYFDTSSKSLSNHTDELADMSIIYGHCMADGTMFGQLCNWKNDVSGKYNSQHPFGIIYTDDGYGYKVTFITSKQCGANERMALHPYDFESYEDKQEYINNCIRDAKEYGMFTLDNYEVKEDDKFVSFVVCAYDYKGQKYQLIGVLEKIKVRDSYYTNDDNGYYVEYNSNEGYYDAEPKVAALVK